MAVLFAAFAVGVALSGGTVTRVAAGIAVVAGLFIAALIQWRLWRQGRLILRDPEDRRMNARKISRSRSKVAPTAAGVGLVSVAMLTAHGRLHLVGVVAAELLCGLVLGYAPVLLWIAFRLRPDERRGERL
jgi:hypothetical protein